jgi:hypothetical protein
MYYQDAVRGAERRQYALSLLELEWSSSTGDRGDSRAAIDCRRQGKVRRLAEVTRRQFGWC